ncbi:MAG: T9SS type A sorting domain-containing protein, partial [Bacteroidota bacterium]
DIEELTNVVDIAALGLQIAPNPTDNYLQIQTDELIDQLQISDIYGRVIWSAFRPDLSTQIDVQDWPSGVYFFSLNTAGQIHTQQIIVY